jgi:hypothetical protein
VIARSSVDRTAAWVGDSVTYTVEILCSPGYDIVEDDIARERLRLDGLELKATETARDAREDGGVVYQARFQLASYETERDSVRIAPMSVRYFRTEAGGRISDQRPAGTADVAGADIVLRSTLPEPAGVQIRTARAPLRLPASIRLLQPLGLSLVGLSVATLAVALAVAVVRSRTPARPERSEEAPRADYRTALAEIRRQASTADPEVLRRALGQLDHLLRDRLIEDHIPASALTPDEIESCGEAAGEATKRHAITRVLRECERVRFGGPGQPLSHGTIAELLDQTEAIVAEVGRER